VIEPRNVTDRGADAVNRAEGNIGCVVSGLGASGPPGSKSRACSQRGCRGTWEIPQSPRVRVEGRGLRHRRSSDEEPATATPRRLGDEQQCVVPPERTKGSEAAWTVGSRSALVVPVKLVNCRPREPVEGSGVPNHGIVGRKHSETSCSSSSVPTQRRRIADQGCNTANP
jgi:hypothetical protein